ncbi:MAG: hypothetical protein ACXAES_09810 [Promethearchaeota archaeon]
MDLSINLTFSSEILQQFCSVRDFRTCVRFFRTCCSKHSYIYDQTNELISNLTK